MIELANKVRKNFLQMPKEDKNLFGGIPFSEDIERKINNHELYLVNGLPNRSRINLGKVYLINNEIVGYTSFTILRNANPTPYEKEFIRLNDKLNYFQFKELFVNPNSRNRGFGNELVNYKLNLAKKYCEKIVCDVKEENKKIINLLNKNGLKKEFEWLTPNEIQMLRLGRNL